MDRYLRYCLCWVLLVPSLTFAATKTITLEPSDLVRTYSAGPYAFSDSRSWDILVDVPPGKARPKVPVTTTRGFSWSAFRGGLKNALKVSPSAILGNAAVAAAVGAVGWVMDPENNTLQRPSIDSEYAPTTSYYWETRTTNSWFFPYLSGRKNTALAACQAAARYPTNPDIVAVELNANSGKCFIVYNGGQYYTTVYRAGTCPAGYTVDSSFNCSRSAGTVPVTDSDYDTFTSGFSDPNVAADIAPDLANIPGSYDYDDFDFSGPSSYTGEPSSVTVTDPATGTTTVTETTPTYNYEYSTDPLSITTTYNETKNTYQNGVLIQSETTNNTTTPTETQLEVPTDCEFMPTVCAFLEWFKEPAPMPEIDWQPIEELPAYSPSIGSGGGTCPAPLTVTTGYFGALQVSYQPLCDFASILRFFTIGGALLFAIYINMGISRSTN